MIFHLLTLAFIVLQLCGVIAWSWFFVLLPSIFIIGVTLGLLALATLGIATAAKYK